MPAGIVPALILAVALALLAAGCGGADDGDELVQGRADVDTAGGSGGRDGGADGGEAAGDLAMVDGDGDGAGGEAPWVVVAHVTVQEIEAREWPSPVAPVVATLANPTPIGGPLVFQVVDPDLDPAARWLEVRLPVRPNGTTGWVRVDEVTLTRNPYRIEIDTSDHQLVVLRENRRFVETTVAIGTGSTPTPIGRFYIIELMQPPSPDGPYGPYAFGLSGFSETLFSFAGGDGVIGIHGTNEPEALGTDVSKGCVRVDNDVIEALAAVVPLGTPVVIRA